MTRRRKLLFGLCTVALILTVLEGGLRLVGFSYLPGEGLSAEARLHELDDDRIYEPDGELLWRLLPSRTIDIGERAYPTFRTNSLGLRGADVPAVKPDGELRVLCLGDSVTFGLGLREGETVPELLEDALAADPPAGFVRVRVVNGGVSNYSAVQGRRLLERLAPLEPDVVVFWFGMNDAKPAPNGPDSELRAPSASAQRVWSMLSWSRLAQLVAWMTRAPVDARRVPVEEFAGIVQRLDRLQSTGGPEVVFVRYPERMEETAAQLAGLLSRAREVEATAVRAPVALTVPYAPAPSPGAWDAEVVDEEGRRVLVVGGAAASPETLPLDEIEQRLERLRAWKAELDARLDTLPAAALTTEELLGVTEARVFTDNCHLTVDGARAAARALARGIRERLVAD